MKQRTRRLWQTMVIFPALLATFAAGAYVISENTTSAEPVAFEIEHALPAEPLVHIAFDGRDMDSKCRELALHQLYQEPEMQVFLKPGLEMLESLLAQAEEELTNNTGLAMNDVMAILSAHFTVTVNDFNVDQATGQPDVDAIVTLAMSAENRGVLAKLAGMLEGAMKDGMGLEAVSVTVGGMSAKHVDMQGEGPNITWAAVNNHLVLGTNQGTLGAVLGRIKAGSTDGGLASSSSYVSAKKRIAPEGRPTFLAYANADRILGLDIVRALADEEPMVDTIIDMVGFEQWTSLGYALSMEGRGFSDRFHIGLKPNATGIWKMPSNDKPLLSTAMAPRDAYYFSGSYFTSEQITNTVDTVTEWLTIFGEEMSGEDIVGQAEGFIAQVENQLGFSLMGDLVPRLGNEAAMWVGPAPYGGLIPEIIVAIGVTDPAAIQDYINKAAAAYDEAGAVGSFSFRDHTIGYFDLGEVIPQQGGPVGFGLKPSWTIHDGNLLFSIAPQILKNFIASSGKQRPNLSENRDLQNTIAQMQRHNPSFGYDALEYIDLGRFLVLAIDTVAPIAQSVKFPDEVPLDFTHFPTSDVFQRHFFGMTAGSTASSAGILSEIHSPMGIGPMVVAIGAGAATIFITQSSSPDVWEIEDLEDVEDK